MPEKSQATQLSSGAGQVTGEVMRAPQVQQQQAGLFGGNTTSITVFRVETGSGQQINCRFEGDLMAPLDLGDQVTISGQMQQGVMDCEQIIDQNGAVIGKTGCFVVTAACGDEHAVEVQTMRAFRDRVLMRTAGGRTFVRLYWRVGPIAAAWMRKRRWLCRCIRMVLIKPACAVARMTMRLGSR
jgi:hypothetical protein